MPKQQDALPNKLLGKAPETVCKINSVPIHALVDTGSQITTLAHHFYVKEFSHVPLQSIANLLKIESVSGDELPYFGYVLLSIEIRINSQESLTEEIPVLIVPDTSYNFRVPLLLGTNILQKLVSFSGCDDPSLTIAIQMLRLTNNHLDKSNGVFGEVNASCDYNISPHSGQIIQASSVIVVPICKQTAVIDSDQIPIIPYLVNVNGGSNDLQVEIFNNTDAEINILKGQKIARLHKVQIEDMHITPENNDFLNSFDFSHLDEPDTSRLKAFLLQNRDVFAMNVHEMGCTDITEYHIDMTDETPFKQKLRPIPPGVYDELRSHINELLSAGVISKSKSPFSSNIVLVRKKTGELRMCVDFRMLNEKCTRDNYRIPRVDMLLDSLKGAKYFCSLDMFSGYYQVKIFSDHRERTAFTTPVGFFQYERMPFGLRNSPAVFQRLADTILDGLLMKTCNVYLDDILVFAKTKDELYENLAEIFDRFRKANLRFKPKKCHFLQEKVEFLGYEVSGDGIKCTTKHIEDVKKWKEPTCVKELQQFLGFMNFFRKHIKNFSVLAEPLTKLLRGHCGRKSKNKPKIKVDWKWDGEQQFAFERLKEMVTSPAILAYPDFEKTFILHCDASISGLGCALYQHDTSGKLRPIAFGSRTLSSSERNYSTHKLEFLALKWAITSKFNYYLYGNKFEVYTDHNPLVYLTTTAKLDALGHRWLAELASYDFKIFYKPGTQNAVADSLSRQVPFELKQDEFSKTISDDVFKELCKYLSSKEFSGVAESIGAPADVVSSAVNVNVMTRVDWQVEQGKDPTVDRVRYLVLNGISLTMRQRKQESPEVRKLLSYVKYLVVKSNILYKSHVCANGEKRLRIVVPEHLRESVLVMSHDDLGHLGRDKTMSIAQERYFWVSLTKSVDDHIKNCKICICAKTPYVPSYAPLVNIVTTKPFELLCMDFLSLEECKGRYRYVLVITDHFTRYSWAFPTRNQEAKTVAKILYEGIILNFGIADRFHSDLGGSFEAKVIYELCQLLNVSKSRTTPYHPMGNGSTERFNRTLISMLRTLSDEQKLNWKDHLSSLVFSYNCCRHDSTGYSPFYLMFGRSPKLPIDIYLGIQDGESGSRTIDLVKKNLDTAFKIARGAAKKAREKQCKLYNRKVRGSEVSVGDYVLIRNVGLKGKHKLANKWLPMLHVVKEQPNRDIPVFVVRPEDGSRDKILHRNMLLPLRLSWMDDPHVKNAENTGLSEVESDNYIDSDDDFEDVLVQTKDDGMLGSLEHDGDDNGDDDISVVGDLDGKHDVGNVGGDGDLNMSVVIEDDGVNVDENLIDLEDHVVLNVNDVHSPMNHNVDINEDVNIRNADGNHNDLIPDDPVVDDPPVDEGVRRSTRVKRPPVRFEDYVCNQSSVVCDWQVKITFLLQLLPIFPLYHSEICHTILYIISHS